MSIVAMQKCQQYTNCSACVEHALLQCHWHQAASTAESCIWRRGYQPLHVYTQVGNAAEVLNSRKAVLAEKELMLENVLEEQKAKVPPCLSLVMHWESSTSHICMHAK